MFYSEYTATSCLHGAWMNPTLMDGDWSTRWGVENGKRASLA